MAQGGKIPKKNKIPTSQTILAIKVAVGLHSANHVIEDNPEQAFGPEDTKKLLQKLVSRQNESIIHQKAKCDADGSSPHCGAEKLWHLSALLHILHGFFIFLCFTLFGLLTAFGSDTLAEVTTWHFIVEEGVWLPSFILRTC